MDLHDVHHGVHKRKPSEARRPRHRLRPRQDRRRGPQGPVRRAGAKQQPAVRRRPDAALPPHPEARLQPTPPGTRTTHVVNVGDLDAVRRRRRRSTWRRCEGRRLAKGRHATASGPRRRRPDQEADRQGRPLLRVGRREDRAGGRQGGRDRRPPKKPVRDQDEARPSRATPPQAEADREPLSPRPPDVTAGSRQDDRPMNRSSSRSLQESPNCGRRSSSRSVPGHLPHRLLRPAADGRPGASWPSSMSSAERRRWARCSASCRMFSGGNLSQATHLRPGHHAVHLGVDHLPAPRPASTRRWRSCRRKARAGRKKINEYTRYATVVICLRPGVHVRAVHHDARHDGPGWPIAGVSTTASTGLVMRR